LVAVGNDESFYAELPTFDDFVEVCEQRHYRAAPDSWLAVVTDVEGSTRAIEAGCYKDVNSIGVASIVALRNAVPDITIPYVFGGDGAIVLVPDTRRDAVEAALRGIRRLAREAFDLNMRAGVVPIGALRAEGFDVLVARYRASDNVDLAMLSGRGVSEAERRIKHPRPGETWIVEGEEPSGADFTGFECRWRPIPSRSGSILSLLVHACTDDAREGAETYRRVLHAIDDVLAEAAPGKPVSPDTLHLQRFGDAFDQEARIRSGKRGGIRCRWRGFKAKLESVIGTMLMRRRWNAFGFPGSVYREEVTANTDFRKFDDMLRMVVDVTPAQRAAIEALLEEERGAGHVVFGLHAAPSSIMTCAISDHVGKHVHFVDGSDGGYALAARQLKHQLETGSPRR
jgi:DUF3095 family protein